MREREEGEAYVGIAVLWEYLVKVADELDDLYGRLRAVSQQTPPT